MQQLLIMGKGKNKKPPISAEVLQGFKYFQNIKPILEELHKANAHHNRELCYDEYILMILMYYFNPVITSMRAIAEVSSIEKVQKSLGIKQHSLSSISEAGYVFDCKLIEPLISELAQKALPITDDSRLKTIGKTLAAVDGSLLPALPKILWALWQDEDHKAAKMHLEFDVIRQMPLWAEITDGNGNEKEVLRNKLCANKLYILDAGYAKYKLLWDIIKAGSNFVVRIRDNAVYSVIRENDLTESDRSIGVQKDMVVHLGSESKEGDPLVRVVEIKHEGSSSGRKHSKVSSKTKSFRTKEADYTMLLVTDRMDLSAELIGLIYNYRWQIELFFRWFKCILGVKHFLSYSENGLTIQVYCALIASMLITLWTGRKPTKRTYEIFCFYFMGLVTDEELTAHINKLKEIS